MFGIIQTYSERTCENIPSTKYAPYTRKDIGCGGLVVVPSIQTHTHTHTLYCCKLFLVIKFCSEDQFLYLGRQDIVVYINTYILMYIYILILILYTLNLCWILTDVKRVCLCSVRSLNLMELYIYNFFIFKFFFAFADKNCGILLK